LKKKIPLYGLERLITSSADTLYIVEGEKDVDTLSRLGYSAAC
jgi:DNA primase